MASKSSKERDYEEISDLVMKIKSRFPRISVDNSSILQPTYNWVYNFYSNFYMEYTQKKNEFANLLGIEPLSEVTLDEAILTQKLSYIYEEMGSGRFYVNDIYEPQPKRTKLFVRLSMNLLLYAESDIAAEGIRQVVEKKVNFDKMNLKKETILNELRDVHVEISNTEDRIQDRTNAINNIKKEYEESLVQKQLNAHVLQGKIDEEEKLKSEVQILHDRLDASRKEEILMRKQIVDEAQIHQYQVELEKCDEELKSIESEVRIEENTLQKYEAICTTLEENLPILSDTLEKSKALKNRSEEVFIYNVNLSQTLKESRELADDSLSKSKMIDILRKDQSKLTEEISLLRKTYEERKPIIQSELKNFDEKIYENNKAKKECHARISKIHEQLEEIRIATEELEIAAEQEHSKILEYQNAVYTEFNQTMEWIEKQNHEAE